MSRQCRVRRFELSCFPRVSGDEPQASIDAKAAELFSPRERG